MNQKKIGDFLRKLRYEKELTQIQLAEILFVSNKSVSRWEKGKSLPDIDILMKLAHFYDVSLEELLDGQRNEMANNTESTALKVAEFENEEKKMKLGMELHGCFQSNEVAETWEKEFRELLQINGTAALYSVARGLVMSITGQSYTGENIVLPMVNVFRLHGENEK